MHGTVVRLKGGDPFIFGRGGEEALALVGAGIAFEVVPGISSAYAVPAYAGIPVTQRGSAAQVTFVTGHEDPAKPGSDLDWASLAATPGTLVFLMGVGALAANAQRLIEHGMRPDTPAAVISNGTLPTQRTVVAPLVGHRPCRRGHAPAGDHRWWAPSRRCTSSCRGTSGGRCTGSRVVVTRARAQASGLAARLEALGAEVVQAPAIRIEPLPFDPPDLAAYDIVCVTSANGVELLLPGDVRALHGVRVAAIGPATVAAAPRPRDRRRRRAGRGRLGVACSGPSATSAGRRVLVATAEGARDVLPDGLREGGARVDVLHLYRTVPEPVDGGCRTRADLVTFTSSSTVTNLAAALGDGGLDGLRRGVDRPGHERDPARVRRRARRRGRPARRRRARRGGAAGARLTSGPPGWAAPWYGGRRWPSARPASAAASRPS